jgi:tRNA pseudouridine65 synthase
MYIHTYNQEMVSRNKGPRYLWHLGLVTVCSSYQGIINWKTLVRKNFQVSKNLYIRPQALSSSHDESINHPWKHLAEVISVVDQGPHHLIVNKPPSIICHHSEWSGSRRRQRQSSNDIEFSLPMLQRIRNHVGRPVNLIHRLDRGASGCLLATYASDHHDNTRLSSSEVSSNDREKTFSSYQPTSALQDALSRGTKTYVALVRGEGILHGEDLCAKGWFTVDRPIRDERGIYHDAITQFRFVAGQAEDGSMQQPRASLVLARPKTGRWHQVRRHLNGLSHPILGDSSHGNSKVNREWREQRGLSGERICLHLLHMSLPPVKVYIPDGINAFCPLSDDMMKLLQTYLPSVLGSAEKILHQEEGLSLQ